MEMIREKIEKRVKIAYVCWKGNPAGWEDFKTLAGYQLFEDLEELFQSQLRLEIEDIFSRLPSKADPMSRDEILERIEEVRGITNNEND